MKFTAVYDCVHNFLFYTLGSPTAARAGNGAASGTAERRHLANLRLAPAVFQQGQTDHLTSWFALSRAFSYCTLAIFKPGPTVTSNYDKTHKQIVQIKNSFYIVGEAHGLVPFLVGQLRRLFRLVDLNPILLLRFLCCWLYPISCGIDISSSKVGYQENGR